MNWLMTSDLTLQDVQRITPSASSNRAHKTGSKATEAVSNACRRPYMIAKLLVAGFLISTAPSSQQGPLAASLP